MPQLNLAAEIFRARLVARRRTTLYALTAVLLGLTVGAWGIPLFLASRVSAQMDDVRTESDNIQAQLVGRRDDVRDIIRFRQQLALLRHRLDRRVGWSNILTALERLTPPGASFEKLKGSEDDGQLQVVVSVPSLDVAADFVASLQEAPEYSPKPFRAVAVVAGERVTELDQPPRYRFTVSVGAMPDLFRLGSASGAS